jgi:integrase
MKKHGLRLKPPKSWRGKRTIKLDPVLVTLLLDLRAAYQRMVAGVPDGADIDLSLIKLPPDALMFPSPTAPFSMTRLRNPKTFTKSTRARFRRLGFKTLRFQDLRDSHATLLLDSGVPVHAVAERLGHDPVVLMRKYAKRTRKASTDAAAVAATLYKGML